MWKKISGNQKKLSENDVGAFIILNLISIYNKNNSKIISLPKKTELRVIFIRPH